MTATLTREDAALAELDALAQQADNLLELYANRGPESPGAFRGADGTLYRVQESRGSGRLYAKVFNGNVKTPGWDYVAGAIYRVREADRLTLEEALEVSGMIGQCVVCGRTLTDPKSVGRGIGPVCRKRLAAERAYRVARVAPVATDTGAFEGGIYEDEAWEAAWEAKVS